MDGRKLARSPSTRKTEVEWYPPKTLVRCMKGYAQTSLTSVLSLRLAAEAHIQDLMSFRDHVFPEDTPEFPSADQVESYLVSYADRFNLKRFIRFSTPVTRLYKRGEWIVESKYGEETFNRVMVSNGHYAETFMPSIPGLS